MTEMKRLQAELGPAAADMMTAHERAGTTDDPDYLAAIAALDRLHICRLPVLPAAINRSVSAANWDIYRSMWGANDYVCTGPLRSWSRLDDLHRLSCAGACDQRSPRRIHSGRSEKLTRASPR